MPSFLLWIKGLPLAVWLALLKVGSAFLIAFRIKQAGAADERAKTNSAILEKAKQGNEIRHKVDADLAAGIRDERLRDFDR